MSGSDRTRRAAESAVGVARAVLAARNVTRSASAAHFAVYGDLGGVVHLAIRLYFGAIVASIGATLNAVLKGPKPARLEAPIAGVGDR